MEAEVARGAVAIAGHRGDWRWRSRPPRQADADVKGAAGDRMWACERLVISVLRARATLPREPRRRLRCTPLAGRLRGTAASA